MAGSMHPGVEAVEVNEVIQGKELPGTEPGGSPAFPAPEGRVFVLCVTYTRPV